MLNTLDLGATKVPEPIAVKPDAAGARAALLDAIEVEALILNLHASLRVHERSHFFNWTQGLLRGLLHQDVLICMQRKGQPASFRIDSFSTIVADAGRFSDALAGDMLLPGKLVEHWQANHRRPVLFDGFDGSIVGRTALAAQLEAVGALQLVLHGCHDVDGEATCLYLFACRAGTACARQLHAFELVVPFLHAAWVRAQLNNTLSHGAPARQNLPIVTARERVILHWIYLGKSNAEIGLILGISPLTVKNHVQNLLRRLNVVNRAQAVGKALEARILKP